MRRRPFHPLRIYVSDGSTYDVRHPEMLMVGSREAVVATQYIDGIAEEKVFCNIRHIVRIGLLDGADAAA